LVNDVGKPGESNNTLRFNGAESGTTRFSRDGNHLTIQAYGTEDSLTVTNYFSNSETTGGIYRQFSFVFDDATLTEADLAKSGITFSGTDGNDSAQGW
ncbi:calcium-binding protein, partial [Rahnella sp. Larv3_ips]|uniref:calcium-binding protein n=1 Tax=Rahnella sp. Larv3_ips TaxID=1896943 RepID=UPI00197DC8E8